MFIESKLTKKPVRHAVDDEHRVLVVLGNPLQQLDQDLLRRWGSSLLHLIFLILVEVKEYRMNGHRTWFV